MLLSVAIILGCFVNIHYFFTMLNNWKIIWGETRLLRGKASFIYALPVDETLRGVLTFLSLTRGVVEASTADASCPGWL